MGQKTPQKNQQKIPEKTPASQEKQKTPEKAPVNPEGYKEYIDLRFTQHEGGVLKEYYEKRVARLESELKECSGDVPNKTVTAAFGNDIVKLQKGVPVPDEISLFIISKGHFDYYFK